VSDQPSVSPADKRAARKAVREADKVRLRAIEQATGGHGEQVLKDVLR
jgi:hypothetical protein